MEDQTPTVRSAALVGAAPAGALSSTEQMRAMLGANTSAVAMAKAIDESFGAAAKKLALGDDLAKRFDFGARAAAMAVRHSEIEESTRRLSMMASSDTMSKLAQHAAQASRVAQLASGASMTKVARAAMGASLGEDSLGQLSSLGAAVAKATSGSAMVDAQRHYRSAIAQAHSTGSLMEEVSKTWPSASSIAKTLPSWDMYKGVTANLGIEVSASVPRVESFMNPAGLAGVRPWVPSPRRAGASRPVVLEDLYVDELSQERDLPEARDRSGVRLELARLRRMAATADTDPLLVIAMSANLLEAMAKDVLHTLGSTTTGKESFGDLLHAATELLGIHPAHPDRVLVVKPLLGAVMEVSKQIWKLRNDVGGSGAHGSDVIDEFLPSEARLMARAAITWLEFADEQLDMRLS